jgi:CDP-diacylglycerol---serine O-phosphatidyltransferase
LFDKTIVLNWRIVIPNLLTLGNLSAGCIGILCAFHQQLHWAGYLIGIAAAFDFFDGFVARLIKGQSEIGKQLDSMADLVTFGVLPGVIFFQLISISLGDYFTPIFERSFMNIFLACLGFLTTLFSAIRLAKFNIDDRQTDHFIGVPTPANAIFIGSIPVVLASFNFNFYHPLTGSTLGATANQLYWGPLKFYTVGTFQDLYFLVITAILSSLLLVAPIPMIAFKFKGFAWKENKVKYTFLLYVLLLSIITLLPYIVYIKFLPVLDLLIIPITIVSYVFYSMGIGVFEKFRK